MARDSYDAQLKGLKDQMVHLCTMIETAIQGAVSALLNQSVDKAEEIAGGDVEIDAQVRLIEQLCYSLLLRQQPVAKDLREVSAALKMITDMERIGDHAEDIAELTILMAQKLYADEVHIVEDMAKEVTVMLIDVIDAYVKSDDRKANRVIAQDDVVDELFDKVKVSIESLIKAGDANAEQDLDVLMVAKYFERIGDHATNIAEWVLFSMTGELPKD